MRPAPAAAAIQRALAAPGTLATASTAAERAALSALYDRAGGLPVWVDSVGRPTRSAHEALALIAGADSQGLNAGDYSATALAARAAMLKRPEPADLADVAAFDAGLSLNVLRYFRQVHEGRVEASALGFEGQREDPPDYAARLSAALDGHHLRAPAAELEPALDEYQALRGMLQRYRALAADSDIAPVVATNRTIHPGDPYPAAASLARLLTALGDLPAGRMSAPADGPVPYEGDLVSAVQRFQARHGLEADGVLGPATQAALAVPLDARVRQIELTLERLRGFPRATADRLVLVNVPMFELSAWDTGRPEGPPRFTSRVIVGRAVDHETPIFTSEMRYLIFRPYWNVPVSIARSEILPAIAKDPDYVVRQRLEIVLGQGDDAQPMPVTEETLRLVSLGEMRIRQRPGPANSLGLVKFMFPNEESVYLHGTPARQLFARARRDFSHGCVRVADPEDFAGWVLDDPDRWSPRAIAAAFQADVPQRVDLARPIQVVLFYATAWVASDGAMHFANDIYGRDAALAIALDRDYQVRTRPVSTWTKSDAG